MSAAEVLFELSHPTRLKILSLLGRQTERLTRVARAVGARNPETSRHLDRLVAAGLVERTPEGAYRATPYGRVLLRSLSGLEFISDNAAYFRTHDLSGLPEALLGRLGELRQSETPGGTFGNFAQDAEIFGGARKRLAVLTTELPDDAIEAFEAKGAGETQVQVIVEKGYHGPYPSETIRHLFRVVSRLPMAAVVSERAACLSFPARDGKIDYSTFFASEDAAFIDWALEATDRLWSEGEYLAI